MTGPWVDLHSHLIPGVDDGARDAADAAAGLKAFRQEGVRRIVTTPHVDGSLTHDPPALAERLDRLDEGWATLRDVAGGEPDLRVGRGVELKLDIPEVDLSDPRLRLDGGPAVLVEFPFFTVPPRSAQALARIREAGFRPLVAHPERYRGLDAALDTVRAWLDTGASLQVNAASLLGRYGPRAEEVATTLLERGWAACLASDYHCRGEPDVARARALLEEQGGEAQAHLLFHENPRRILDGEAPTPVPPLTPPSGLRRLMRRLGRRP